MVVIGFCAPSKTGKTTFLERLIPILLEEKYVHGKIGIIKHCHHALRKHPHTDSNRLRKAGAHHVLATNESNFESVLSMLPECQLILVEGFRSAPIPFFLLHRDRVDLEWEAPKTIIKKLNLIDFEESITDALATIHLLLLAQ